MGDRVVSFEIGCDDLSSTSEFYERVFGWTTEDYGPDGRSISTGVEDGLTGHIVALNDWPNALNFYIEVEDIAAKLEMVKAAGGEALVGPLPTPDGGHFAWIRDVAGNVVGLLAKR